MDERDAAMIDALRRSHQAFNRGDFDVAVESAHPEIEFIPPGGQAPLRGAAALRAWMEPNAFEEQRIEPLDFRVEGNKGPCPPAHPGSGSRERHQPGSGNLDRLDVRR